MGCVHGDARPSSGWTQSRPREEGFTLIEMMAVIVIFGLLAAVVLPSFQRWFQGLDARVQAAEVAARLQKLLARATLMAQPLELSRASAASPLADGKPALVLPDGWRIADEERLQINPSGVCPGGQLLLIAPTGNVRLRVAAGSCDVSVERLGT